MPGPQLIEMPISCKLCNKQFPAPQGVVLDQNPNQQTAQFVQRLAVHLKERHPQEQMAAALSGAEYTGMLTLLYFNLSGSVELQRDFLRWRIQQQTRRASVTDERILERVLQVLSAHYTAEELERTMSHSGQIGFELAKLMRDMRDSLMEVGRYTMSPQIPELSARPQPIDA